MHWAMNIFTADSILDRSSQLHLLAKQMIPNGQTFLATGGFPVHISFSAHAMMVWGDRQPKRGEGSSIPNRNCFRRGGFLRCGCCFGCGCSCGRGCSFGRGCTSCSCSSYGACGCATCCGFSNFEIECANLIFAFVWIYVFTKCVFATLL